MNAVTPAAGGVVWRKNSLDEVEVAIIHRPRYNDWSIPKGKLDNGETLIACAYREIMEETGLSVQLGPYIGDVEYFAVEGPKRVSYWSAKAIDSEKTFFGNNEVDLMEWHQVDAALEKLTRETDIEILTKFLEVPFDSTPLILLRHAKALARSEWQSGDEDRPLEIIGQQQARRMLATYQVFGLSEIHTSDAVRCYDTVIAMTKALGIEPKITNHLSEYTFKKDKEKSLDYAKKLVEQVQKKGEPILLCSHNPVLPRMLEKITKKSGIELPESKLLPGEAWVVYFDKKNCVLIESIPAPVG